MAKYGHPIRTLVIFLVVLAGLFVTMAVQHTWSPKLGLDLRGGTTITLTARTTDGGAPTAESLEQARTIVQNRVDSLGVGESEVTTSGDREIQVSVPNVQQDELVRMVGQTAVLSFRAVKFALPTTPRARDQPAAGPGQAAGRHPGRTEAQLGPQRRPADPDRVPQLDLQRQVRRDPPERPAVLLQPRGNDEIPAGSHHRLRAGPQDRHRRDSAGPAAVGGEPAVQRPGRQAVRGRHPHPVGQRAQSQYAPRRTPSRSCWTARPSPRRR